MQVATRSLHARCACCGRAASQGAAHPSSPRRQHRIGARHARHVPQPTGCRAQAARHRSRQLCSPLGRGPQAGRWQGAPHAGARTPSSMAGPYAMTMSLPRRGGDPSSGRSSIQGSSARDRATAGGVRPRAAARPARGAARGTGGGAWRRQGAGGSREGRGPALASELQQQCGATAGAALSGAPVLARSREPHVPGARIGGGVGFCRPSTTTLAVLE